MYKILEIKINNLWVYFNKKNNLKLSNFVLNVFTLLTGTTIAQAIPIIVSPILSRLYTPDEFGVFAIYMSIISIISVISNGKYESAIMLPEKENEAFNIFSLSLFCVFITSVSSFFILLILKNYILYLLNIQSLGSWIFYIPIIIFFMGVYKSIYYWLNRNKKFKIRAKSMIVRSIVIVIINVVMGIQKFGYTGLILGCLFGEISAVVYLILKLKKEIREQKKYIDIKLIKKMTVQYKKFPLFSTWSSLLNSTSFQIPIFLLTKLFNSSITGGYSISHRSLAMPSSLLGVSVGQVYFQKASENISNLEKLKKITFEVYKNMLYIGVIPIAIITVYGDIIFSILFGVKWLFAGKYAQFIGVWIFFSFISVPLSSLFDVLQKQKEEFIFNMILLVSRIGSLVLGGLLLKDSSSTILILGVTSSCIYFIYSIYLLKLVNIKYIVSISFTLKITVPVFIIILLSRYLIGV